MTTRLRRYIAVTMALVLVLTGHSMAIARGMPGVAGYAEFCISESAVMVPVDADGNPTGPAHVCPDISFALMIAVAPPHPQPIPATGNARVVRFENVTPPDVIRVVVSSARAPPARFV